VVYSIDLKLRCFTPSGASAIFRIAPPPISTRPARHHRVGGRFRPCPYLPPVAQFEFSHWPILDYHGRKTSRSAMREMRMQSFFGWGMLVFVIVLGVLVAQYVPRPL
jgi:hypothetical protein